MPDQIDAGAVRYEPDAGRFVLPIDGRAEAAAYCEPAGDGALVMTHTVVPDADRGHGVGSALAAGVFRIARERGLRLILRCPFLVAWYADHPDYADVVQRA